MSTQGLITFETVCELARELPEVEEGTAYRTPALRVRKKILARLREDGETLAIKINFGEREFRLQSNPDVFYITDHYNDSPMILVRLAKVDHTDLRELVHGAWRMVAPKRLRDQFERDR